jgi:hypothetical protein
MKLVLIMLILASTFSLWSKEVFVCSQNGLISNGVIQKDKGECLKHTSWSTGGRSNNNESISKWVSVNLAEQSYVDNRFADINQTIATFSSLVSKENEKNTQTLIASIEEVKQEITQEVYDQIKKQIKEELKQEILNELKNK